MTQVHTGRRAVVDMRIMKCILCAVSLLLLGKVDPEYLKSDGDIKILEGHDIELTWTAHGDTNRAPPCSWRYATHRNEEGDIFLAFASGERYDFNGGKSWDFLNINEPCLGGIQKQATPADTGVYTMEVKDGHSLKAEDKETYVQVYRVNDLKFKVIVNGYANIFDLAAGSNFSLDVIPTAKPVNVTVTLSKAFPPTVIMIRRSNNEVCDRMLHRCTKIIDFGTDDVLITVEMKTGIIGVDPVIISQPIRHDIPKDNGMKSSAITFGILFFVVFIIVIVIVSLLIVTMRRARTMTKTSKPVSSKKQPIKRMLLEPALDLKESFSVKSRSGGLSELKAIVEKNNHQIDSLKKRTKCAQDNCLKATIKFRSLFESTNISLQDVSKMCERKLNEMSEIKDHTETQKGDQRQPSIIRFIRWHIKSVSYVLEFVTSIKDEVTSFEHEVTSFEHDVKEFEAVLSDWQYQATTAEDCPKDVTEMDSLHKVVEQQTEQSDNELVENINKQLELIKKLQELDVSLTFMLCDIDRLIKLIDGEKLRLNTLESLSSSIMDSFKLGLEKLN